MWRFTRPSSVSRLSPGLHRPVWTYCILDACEHLCNRPLAPSLASRARCSQSRIQFLVSIFLSGSLMFTSSSGLSRPNSRFPTLCANRRVAIRSPKQLGSRHGAKQGRIRGNYQQDTLESWKPCAPCAWCDTRQCQFPRHLYETLILEYPSHLHYTSRSEEGTHLQQG